MTWPRTAVVGVGSTLAGKYRLDQELGRGGMGAVYLAENVVIGRKVAIKLLHPSVAEDPLMLARFRMEARAAGAIGHPGIVDVLDLGTTEDGSEFIVMERLEGTTLSARLRERGRLDAVEAVGLVAPVLDALAAAHGKGIIHRDLKPENIFVLSGQAAVASPIKILDFGISKFRGEGDLGLTATGAVMGSPLYMSPEQARGARDVGPPTDLYAVGVILYQALAGRPPFEGEYYNEVLAKLLTEEPPPLSTLAPEVPPELAAIVTALLAKDPAARPHSAWELRAALLRAVDTGATRPDASLPEGVVREVQRRRSYWVAGGALAVVAAALGVAALRPPSTVASGGPPRGAPTPAPAAPVTAGAAPAPVAITLRAEPAAARWFLDGEALGCNPCQVSRQAGSTHRATASADGFVEGAVELAFEAPRTVELPLAPRPPPTAASLAPASARTLRSTPVHPPTPAGPGRAPSPAPAATSPRLERDNPYR